jgi:hypothetical protein
MREYNRMYAQSKQSLPIEIAVQDWCGRKSYETPYATLDNIAHTNDEKDSAASPLVQAIKTLLHEEHKESN